MNPSSTTPAASSTSPAKAILGVTLAVAIAHLLWWAPRLPETVASHFAADGHADGWSPRHVYLIFLGIADTIIAVLFLIVHVTMYRIAARSLNVPNRDYWLAPERELLTRRMLGRSTLWLGWGTLVLMIAVAENSFRANFTPERSVGWWPWYLLAGYAVFGFGWMGRMLYRLMNPPRDAFNPPPGS